MPTIDHKLARATLAIDIVRGNSYNPWSGYNLHTIASFNGTTVSAIYAWWYNGISHLFTNKLSNWDVNLLWLDDGNYQKHHMFRSWRNERGNMKFLTFQLTEKMPHKFVHICMKHEHFIGQAILDGKKIAIYNADGKLSIANENHDAKLLKELWKESKVLYVRKFMSFVDWYGTYWEFDKKDETHYATARLPYTMKLRYPHFITDNFNLKEHVETRSELKVWSQFQIAV